MFWKKPDVKKRTHNYPPKKNGLENKKNTNTNILGDRLSTAASRHPHPGVHGALQPEIPDFPAERSGNSQQKPKGKSWGQWQDVLLDFWQVFVGLKKFVSSNFLCGIWLNCCESNENENTPDVYRLTPTLSCEGWEKSGGYCLFVWVSSRIKLSEVHLDMVNCGGDGDQYCPVRLLCPQKTRQQLCSPAKLLISLLEGGMSGHPSWKASVSNKETNHFWQKRTCWNLLN